MTSAGSHASVSGTPGMMIAPAEREGDFEKNKVNNDTELNRGKCIFVVIFQTCE